MPLFMPDSDIPRDLVDAAADADDAIGSELLDMIPTPSSPYNVKVLDALARAIAAVGKVMGMELEAEKYSEPTTRLDDDVVRFLAMFDAAARDYGKPFPVRLEAIRGDAELTAITAHLMKLARDADFAKFLDSPADDADVRVEVRADVDGEEEEEEFDFASRMRRR